ncbi:hypothetical protein CLAIMM_14927 [Cladophialophora immunda]|nr:hypothetical protein CLAIMM_14927 [Cladophialophora immunda]
MAKHDFFSLRGRKLQIAMLGLVVFPAYGFLGYNNVVMGGLVSNPSFIKQFPSTDTVHTTGAAKAQNARIEGTVVALYLVGAMFGALSCWKIGDRLGRLRTTMIGATSAIIGWIFESSSFSLGQLIVGRLVVGLGTGMISATVPIWQSECSPASHRGVIVVLEGTFSAVAIALCQWLELGFFFAETSATWRFPLAFPITFAMVILICAPMMPESPRWLVKHGRLDEARHIVSVLEDTNEESEIVTAAIEKMQYSLRLMSSAKFKDLLSNGDNRLLNRTLVAMFSTFSQQMSGIAVVGFYTVPILEDYMGLSQVKSRIVSASIYSLQLVCSIVTCFTVERIGRRKLMMIGIGGMGVMAGVLAGTTSRPENRACAIASTVAIFLFVASFGLGTFGVNYLYGAEVSPLAYRVPIYAVTATTLWSFNFLSTEVSPIAFATLESRYFIVYCALDLCVFLPSEYNTRRRTGRL